MNVNPLAEQYVSFTPYAYVGNRSLIAIDSNGMEIRLIGGRLSGDQVIISSFLRKDL